YVEVVLGPGIFLRIGPNSTVVLNALNPDVRFSIPRGEALIDTFSADKQRRVFAHIGEKDVPIASGKEQLVPVDRPLNKEDDLVVWSEQRKKDRLAMSYPLIGRVLADEIGSAPVEVRLLALPGASCPTCKRILMNGDG